jgi:hypothetical protein
MSRPTLTPIDRAGIPPRPISTRLRSQLVYFAAAPGDAGVPPLGEGEFYFPASEVDRILDDGVFELVSPLDTAGMTEVEISEEQEELLGWLKQHGIQHVRASD